MSFALRLAALGLLCAALVRPDWVEIPHFSDQDKVYRPTKQPSEQLERFAHRVSFHREETGLRNVSANRRRPGHEPSFVGTVATYTTERVANGIVGGSEAPATEADEGVFVQSFEQEDQPVFQFQDPPPIADSDFASATSETPETTSRPEPDKGFFDYLPVDLLERVHKTLKSQPATLKGKIRFLKLFERTLVKEIGSRLSAALSTPRSVRKARTHDDNDDGIGFPSLEGTLMAISFLTFAVYLVRLVMMLFRSAGSNGNSNNGTPIYIGRKRRSVDDFTDETARILGYLESNSFTS